MYPIHRYTSDEVRASPVIVSDPGVPLGERGGLSADKAENAALRA